MKQISACLWVIVITVIMVSGVAQAQEKKVYQWTDENGVVHFSDTKPEGQEAETRELAPAPPATTSNPYQQPPASGPSAADQKRQEIAQKKQEARAEHALNDAQCAAWQAEVDRLEPHRRVFYTNEQGETVRMDDVERTNRVAELKGQIARNCK